MPTVTRQGSLRLPVIYETWSEWREEQPAAIVAPVRTPAPGAPCGTCWGQGRILRAAGNGEGLVPGPCWGCGGTGSAPPAA